MQQAQTFAERHLFRLPCRPGECTGEMFHKHQCPHCRTTWAHLDVLPELGLSRHDFDEAHTCPNCGTKQYHKLQDAEEVRKYLGGGLWR